jgi:ferredoxin
MPVVTFFNEFRAHEVETGTNLRAAMLRLGITPYKGLDIATNCRGHNFCGTCAVDVVDGKGASPRGQEEEATLVGSLAIARQVDKNLRLACQTMVVGDMTVRTHPAREVDWAVTKQRLGLLGVVSFFALTFLGVFVFMLLDMIKVF